MAEDMPYERSDTSWAQLTFGPPRRLDTTTIRQVWRPWFELRHEPGAPICATSTPYLLDLLDLGTPGGVPEAPYCGLVVPADARSRLARQARADEFLGATPADVAVSSGEARWHALADHCGAWHSHPPLRRAILVSALTQLGFYAYALSLVGDVRPSSDPDEQHLLYETARAARRRPGGTALAAELFGWLAAAGTPALAVLACTQLISLQARDRRAGAVPTGRWAARGADLLEALDLENPWLRGLVRSRYHRVIGYEQLRRRNRATARAMFEAARADDEFAREHVATALAEHCSRENRRLLADTAIRAGSLLYSPAELDRHAQLLLRLDGDDPRALFSLGELACKAGDAAAAATRFEQAARLGTCRGAVAAYHAADLWRWLGDLDRASAAVELLLDLDPAALVPEVVAP